MGTALTDDYNQDSTKLHEKKRTKSLSWWYVPLLPSLTTLGVLKCFPSLYHKFLSNDMWLPSCPRTATLLKAWKLPSLLCFELSWQNPAGNRLDTRGCWRRSKISRGHSIAHKIQLFFFVLICSSYSAVVYFWRNLDFGCQELKHLAPGERLKSFMKAAQILAKAFVSQDILSEGSIHETYQLLVVFMTMRDLNPLPLPLADHFKFIR